MKSFKTQLDEAFAKVMLEYTKPIGDDETPPDQMTAKKAVELMNAQKARTLDDFKDKPDIIRKDIITVDKIIAMLQKNTPPEKMLKFMRRQNQFVRDQLTPRDVFLFMLYQNDNT